ncbi:UNKNOWN [Stylonychia lemnae]|uniref:Cyclin-like domain-containing protein n=1 Tax=Stylonychia lemnae TaxID=5949 RepID=A0A078ADJ7_STYLE|nr:UNKNOWN [Stylonychia lemnae]|eukprot:CDW78948.1 UNKNOWN [Stylonychia lemnae]
MINPTESVCIKTSTELRVLRESSEMTRTMRNQQGFFHLRSNRSLQKIQAPQEQRRVSYQPTSESQAQLQAFAIKQRKLFKAGSNRKIELGKINSNNLLLPNIPIKLSQGNQTTKNQKDVHQFFKDQKALQNIQNELISKKFNSSDLRQYNTFEINPSLQNSSGKIRATTPKSPVTLEESSLMAFDFHGLLGPQKASNNSYLQYGLNLPRISEIEQEMNGDEKLPDYLSVHKIKTKHRLRMLDWMIQVFRVFKVSAPQTFFLAVQIMDRYFMEKYKLKQILHKSDLHEIGLVSMHISSKYEDVIPIFMSQILKDAGHNRFKQQDILQRERDVLQALGFKIMHQDNSQYIKKIVADIIKFKLGFQEYGLQNLERNFPQFLAKNRISTPKLLESLPEISNISGSSIDIDQQSSEKSQSNEPRIIPQEPNKITNFKIQKQIITSNIGISYSECNRRL